MEARTLQVGDYIVGRGGTNAIANEFPFLVRLTAYGYDDDTKLCGGSILGPLLILTAAHCLVGLTMPSSTLAIVAGDHRRDKRESTEQYRAVEKIYIHPQYDMVNDTKVNDIAILVLANALKFNSFVKSITMADASLKFSKDSRAFVAGWGRTDPNSGITSPVVRKGVVSIVDYEVCRKHYLTTLPSKAIIPKIMLCAGGNDVDSCDGDSGGPLICLEQHSTGNSVSKGVLCGIVSFGLKPYCGHDNIPGVYTGLTEYLDWIQKTIAKHELRGKCPPTQFYCPGDAYHASKCIHRSKICDGIQNCDGGEDEAHCECRNPHRTLDVGSNTFRCSNGCSIQMDWICDGMKDCSDGSDEEKCSTGQGLSGGDFRCRNRTIPLPWKCDRIKDCEDGSDEPTGCGYRVCTEDEFQCHLSVPFPCIPKEDRCDRINDCANGEDELNCGNLI